LYLFVDVTQFRKEFDKAKHIAIITGAGVSAESGVPTFRGQGGYWRKWQAQVTHTHVGFLFVGDSLALMIVYCTNCILYPLTLTLPITENFLHVYIFQSKSLSMIYKLFSSWGSMRILDICIFVGIILSVYHRDYQGHTYTHNVCNVYL